MQVLPLVPPDEEYFSPYSGQDALCGNPLLISLERLAADGLIAKGTLERVLLAAWRGSSKTTKRPRTDRCIVSCLRPR